MLVDLLYFLIDDAVPMLTLSATLPLCLLKDKEALLKWTKNVHLFEQFLMDKTNDARLIDWGLIGISTPRQIIPEAIEGRPIQFNVPFSSILFEPTFKTWYERKLRHHTDINKKSPIINDDQKKTFKYDIHGRALRAVAMQGRRVAVARRARALPRPVLNRAS